VTPSGVIRGWETPQEWAKYWKIIEGSLEVNLPTLSTDDKHSRAEAERRERL
jgi:hypothetical protein